MYERESLAAESTLAKRAKKPKPKKEKKKDAPGASRPAQERTRHRIR